MTRRIYIVSHDDYVDMTVIAESIEQACILAAIHHDEPERADDYDGSERVQSGRRWVQFGRLDEAEEQVREMDNAGADRTGIFIRVTYRGRVESGLVLFVEVGAFDSDWCRLPVGALCGGEQ